MQPEGPTALRNIFSPDVDPTDRKLFDSEDGAELSGTPGTMVDLINRCMHEEMERDPRIVVFGEDVADCSREQYLETVKGKGVSFMENKIGWHGVAPTKEQLSQAVAELKAAAASLKGAA